MSCPVRAQKYYSAVLLVHFRFETRTYVSKKNCFSKHVSPLHSHSLTLRKINYIYLLIAINYSRSIRCVNAYQMTGFCMSLIFTAKSTSKQTLISQAFDLVGKAEGVYDFLLSSSKLGDMNLMSNA